MKRPVLILIIIFLTVVSREAAAFWGSGEGGSPSGLNVETGFDVNTVTTLSGMVTLPPESRGPREPAVLSMATSQGMVNVVLGPSWYWEQQHMTFSRAQEITVTGSRAQGKEGSFYLFAQRIESRSDGKTVTLRSENGVPLWSRGGSGSHGGGRQGGMGKPARSGGQGSGMRGGRH